MKKMYLTQVTFMLFAFVIGLFAHYPVLAQDSTTVVYTATEDTYVYANKASTNYGSTNPLQAKYLAETKSAYRAAYIKFDIPSSVSGKSIKLRLYAKINDSNAASDATLTCSIATANSSWNASTMTYNTRPAVQDIVAEFEISGKTYRTYTIDVTKTVQAYAEQGETEITFVYLGGPSYITWVSSLEAETEAERPALVVQDLAEDWVNNGVTFQDEDGNALEGIQANSAVTCRLHRSISGGKAIFASYDKDGLVSVAMDDATEGNKLTVMTGDGVLDQRLRVYVWDDDWVPLVPAVEFYNSNSVSKSLLTELGTPGESALVQEVDGALVYYPYTENGDILPDFSGVGYMGGSEDFPTSTVVENVSPPASGDAKNTIQKAIDKVSALSPDGNGIRGVVLLKNGTYNVSGTLKIKKSGVILRGESRNSTIIRATGTSTQESVVSVGSSASITEDTSGIEIDADYVPVGTKVLPLESTAGLAVGDDIVIVRPQTSKWIADIGMDRNGIFASSTNADLKSWDEEREGKYEFHFERKIVAVDGNSITIDHPIVMSMQKEYGGGQVKKVLSSGRISQVGIESITFESAYDDTVLAQKDGVTYYADEEHADRAVLFSNAENCWAQNVSAKYFINECVEIGETAKYVTVINCSATDFVSKIEGSRRYGFEINGQLSLVKNCVTDTARHAFVQGSRTRGPNVFYDCTSTNDYGTSEPHHRWAMGCLYDNVRVTMGLQAVQRGDQGTGHGWAGANMVFWNCAAPHIGVMQPPTAQNFAIGVSAVPASGTEAIAKERIQKLNSWAKTAFSYTGYPFAGDGYMELLDRPAKITSLYIAQQNERMN